MSGIVFHVHVQAHLACQKAALLYGVPGSAATLYLRLWEHTLVSSCQSCVFIFPAWQRPQVPGARLCRHSTVPAMPAERSHGEGGCVGKVRGGEGERVRKRET